MSEPLKNFQYLYIDNGASSTLFLLHGTGGTEHDLLQFVEPLKNRYNFVGLKGNISENGLARFFKRTAPGTFDYESIKNETDKLHSFLIAWKEALPDSCREVAFLGYSNGANMILALSFFYPSSVPKAALLHPMLPFEPEPLALSGTSFLVSYGEKDEMVPAEKSRALITLLRSYKAEVSVVISAYGHELHREEILSTVEFLS